MKKNKEWLKEAARGMCQSRVLQSITINVDVLDNIIDQLDEPEKVVVSKMEKVVIPQFVADWIKECKARKHNLFGVYQFSPEVVSVWIFENESKKERVDLIARAWLDGYTIEKETMYRVVFPFTGSSEKTLIQRIFTGNTWADDVEDDFEIIAEDHKVEFTEQEIKAIDERYWAFAEEVTE